MQDQTVDIKYLYLEKIPIPGVVIGREGNFIYQNLRFANLFELQQKNIYTIQALFKTYSLSSIDYQENINRWNKNIDTRFKENKPRESLVVNFIGKSNTHRYFEIDITVEDKFIIALFEDITIRINTLNMLGEEKAQNDALFKSLPGIVFVYDELGKLIKSNLNHALDFGYDYDEIIGKNYFDWIDNDLKDTARKIFEEGFEKGFRGIELEFMTKDRKKIPYLLYGLPYELENKNYLCGIGVDMENINYIKNQLKESRSRFELFSRLSFEGIIIFNTKGIIADVNDRLCDILGYPRNELVNNNGLDIFFDDFKKEEIRYLMNNPNETEGNVYEIEFKNKSGKPIYTEARIGNLPISDNTEELKFAVVRDITLIKKSKDSLLKSEERFKLLSKITFEGILIHEDGIIKDVNYSLTRMLQYSREEMIGKHYDFMLTPESLLTIKENYDVGSQKPYELVGIKKDGTHFPIEIEVKKYETDANEILRVVAVRDITQRKNAQKLLLESENRLSTVFDLAPVIMLIINDKREILQINKRGIESFGKDASGIHGMPLGLAYNCMNQRSGEYNCGYTPDCSTCVIRNTINDTFKFGKSLEKIEAKLNTQSGEYILLISSVLMSEYNPRTALITIDDITQSKRLEHVLKRAKDTAVMSQENLLKKNEEYHQLNEELKQNFNELIEANEALKAARERAVESDRLKTSFLQNVSHEIRTPLNGIIGFAAMLGNIDLDDDTKKYYIDIINESSQQLLSIVDDILSISRIETGQTEIQKIEISLNGLIQELGILYSNRVKLSEKNIEIQIHTPLSDEDSMIYADDMKYRQVISNLISNAVKFTKNGHVKFGYNLRDGDIEFFVEDTGIGIPEEFHTKIFERFRQVDLNMTRTYGGTGLGLSIVKGYTSLLGGKIRLKSKPGEGSTFYFSIPYEPVNEILKPPSNKNANKNRPVILIAEDEEVNYLFIEETLCNIGAKFYHAINGEEAVEMCKKFDDIQLVLMDIKMPLMNGFDAFREIRINKPNLPIVAQTAYAMRTDRKRALDAGFDDYLSKPIKVNELIKVVKRFCQIPDDIQ